MDDDVTDEEEATFDSVLRAAAHPTGQLLLQLIPWRGKELAAYAKALDEHRKARRAERAAEVVSSAAEAVGGEAAFLERVADSEEFEELVYRAAEVAVSARDQAKRRALRRALVVAARDSALVDEERLIVDALAGLEPPHVRLLDALVTVHQQPRSPEAPAPDFLEAAEVNRLFPNPVGVALLAHLVSVGLVEAPDNTWGGPSRSKTTLLGVRLVDYLRNEEWT